MKSRKTIVSVGNKPVALLAVLLLFCLSSLTAQVNFTNSTSINIPGNAAPPIPGSPYPSVIEVSGLNGVISTLTVTLNNLTHEFPDEMDILLVAPDGTNAVILSDVGGAFDVAGITIKLDDAASAHLPDNSQITSGSYKPTNMGTGDAWPSPAPAPSSNVALTAFKGLSPNGSWSLYVVNDGGEAIGSINGGWTLSIATETTIIPVQLLYFTADHQEEQHQVQLTWMVTDEKNSHSFTIETSPDGMEWKAVGLIPAAGNSSAPRTYRFLHRQPSKGRNEYRLKLSDRDGSFTYSKVVTVFIAKEKQAATRLYPNPATYATNLYTQQPQPQVAFLQLYTISGNLVKSIQGVISKTLPVIIDTSALTKGVYLLKAMINGAESIQQLMIK